MAPWSANNDERGWDSKNSPMAYTINLLTFVIHATVYKASVFLIVWHFTYRLTFASEFVSYRVPLYVKAIGLTR
jgi:hypothetical protein